MFDIYKASLLMQIKALASVFVHCRRPTEKAAKLGNEASSNVASCLVTSSDGLQPNSDGRQPNNDGRLVSSSTRSWGGVQEPHYKGIMHQCNVPMHGYKLHLVHLS